MSQRRRGMGRGLGALIPQGPAPEATAIPDGSPVDVLIPREAQQPSRSVTDLAGWARASAAAATAAPADAEGDVLPAHAPGAGGDAHDGDAHYVGAHYTELPLDSIVPNPRQPRMAFDEDAQAELVASIQAIGLLQPIVVRPAAFEGGTHELVMGERRWRAAAAAGLERIPALVRRTEDADLLRDALLENLHRSQLNALEEGAAYDQLLKDFHCTHEELAVRLGRSRPQISNTIRLLGLPPSVQRRVAAGVLSAGHARALLALPDAAAQEALALRIVSEGLSVRAVEEAIASAPSISRATRPRSRKAPPSWGEGADRVAERLSERLETRVTVLTGRARGKLVVEFATREDLDRLVDLIDPAAAPDPVRQPAADDPGLPDASEHGLRL